MSLQICISCATSVGIQEEPSNKYLPTEILPSLNPAPSAHFRALYKLRNLSVTFVAPHSNFF